MTVDHRLASEQGRAKIQEDFTKSGMIVDTVALIATTDRVGITDFFKETGKSHTTYEAIKSEIANNPELAAQLARDDLTPTEKEAMLNQLTHRVMVDLGYSTADYQNVLVANNQDYVVKDGVTYERHGFYSEATQNAYINDALISNTQGLVTTAGHELSHAMDDRSDTQHSKQDNETYATQFGNNFGNYTNVTMAVTGNVSMAGNNLHVGNNSEKVRSQTEGYNQLDKGQGDDLLFLAAPAADLLFLAAPAAAPLISPAAVTAVVSLATAFGLKANEDNIAEMLGVESKPTIYITPEHTANPDDTRVEGSAIVQGEAKILTTPVHQDNNGLLVNIPVGLDVNGNSGGYQPHPISLDDLVMMAENSNDLSRADFYVKPDGTTVPSTGYRAFGGHSNIEEVMGGVISPRDPTYITFDNIREMSPEDAKNFMQLPRYPSHVVSFDTLQIIDDLNIPDGRFNTNGVPEPITQTFPEWGYGGATQAITNSPIRVNPSDVSSLNGDQ